MVLQHKGRLQLTENQKKLRWTIVITQTLLLPVKAKEQLGSTILLRDTKKTLGKHLNLSLRVRNNALRKATKIP